MIKPLADQLLAREMNDLDISLVLARLQDEHYVLDATSFLADVLAPNSIHAIATLIWTHLHTRFTGKVFCLDPHFLKAHVDWAGAWRQLRQQHGMGCVQLPKDPNQNLVRFVFVAGPNDLCSITPNLQAELGNAEVSDRLKWST